ncbi:hypothetical protein B9Z19DRAFT_1126042 [Tuber borchii]|uniref:Monooxygenase n=1 Tax=Tuber borchii TaxID=42251 RepID=A0A2T6ZTG6_TUBBO|nr:hypothetical protein B9Z19DRAFT_1126042 [Tuber borchii]
MASKTSSRSSPPLRYNEIPNGIQGRGRWRLSLQDLKTGDAYFHECKILFTAQGLLVEQNYPKIPGLETFKGHVYHSACWDHSVDLKGKKVAIIGSGWTATQIVPAIAPEVEVVKQFIRTPHWILPPPVIEYSDFDRWMYKNVPLAYRFHRLLVFASMEWNFRLFGLSRYSQGQRDRVREGAIQYLYGKAPEKYHELLLPDYQIACKQRILDSRYLTSLNRPNVQVHKEKAIEITPRGIKGSSGIHDVDFFKGMEVLGRNGVSADQHWDGIGGIGAYNTTAMHNFLNFFILLGPNSVTGHTSAIVAIENTVDYALRVLKPVLRGYASRVEVKERSEKEYVHWIQAELRQTLWNTGCTSWYTSNGWNSMTYPWSQLHYYYRSRVVKAKDWDVTCTTNPLSLMKLHALILFLVGICVGAIWKDMLEQGFSSVWELGGGGRRLWDI